MGRVINRGAIQDVPVDLEGIGIDAKPTPGFVRDSLDRMNNKFIARKNKKTKPKVAPILGFVATNAQTPDWREGNSGNTNVKGYASRSRHVASEKLTNIVLKFAHFFVNLNAGDMTERGDGLTTQKQKVSIEYPAGVIHATATFGGQPAGTVSPMQWLVTDPLAVDIPAGAVFYVRRKFYHEDGSQPGVPIQFFGGVGANDEYFCYLTDVGQDPTADGSLASFPNDWNQFRAPPAAILQMTTKPSWLILGDSIAMGSQDQIASNPEGAIGYLGRELNRVPLGFSNMAYGNDRASFVVASHALRSELYQHATHVFMAWTNDLNAGDSAEVVHANVATIRSYFRSGVKFFMPTLPPIGVGSTDDYTTLANQNVNVGMEGRRSAFNTTLRAGIAGVNTWEYADVLEEARSGKFKIVPDKVLTTDGLHPKPDGYQLIADSGASVISN